METEINPIFKKEWNKQDFTKAEKAIVKHLRGKTMKTHRGNITFGRSYKNIDSILGLAYTSSSSSAMLNVCNIDLYHEQYYYTHFCISEKGNVFAVLWDKEENEKLLQL